MTTTTSESTVINRIMGLLAKAEATEFEEEAATYLAKAQELMIKYAVDQSQLRPAERETVTEVRFPMGRSKADQQLMFNLAHASDMVALTHSRNGAVYEMSLIGTPTDIAYIQALYASLVLQREAARAREYRPSYVNGRTFAHSFRLGFGARVYTRLISAKNRTVADAGTGAELVLVGKKGAAEQHRDQLYPKLSKGRAARVSDARAYRAGAAAGERADISGGRGHVNGKRELH